MLKVRDSISRKLTVMNMLVSGTAVLLACAAFFAYDVSRFERAMTQEISTQAQIVGLNAVSPLVFNDPKSAEQTLSALQASTHIIYAGIYTPSGQFFAGYWRATKGGHHSPPLALPGQIENHWFQGAQFGLIRPVVFNGRTVGTVYIRSDLQGFTTRLRSYLIILACILFLSLLAALVVSRVMQRAISTPVVRLAETARIVSRDKNYAVRVVRDSGTGGELGVLIAAFNDMLAEIQKRDTILQESEEQFRTLADSVPQLAWIAEADGAIIWYNRRWYEYTGTRPEQMTGWGWQSVHDPAALPAVLAQWRNTIATGQKFEMVFPLRGKDGMFRDFLTLVVPVRDAHGKVVRWFGTNTDVTEQRRAEEALSRTEKLAATGRLAASIAHEINNPLEAVTNLVYLARRNTPNAQAYLAMIDQEVDRIAQITKHTLGFYRDTSTPTRVSLAEVLHEVTALYARKFQFKKIVLKERYAQSTDILGFPGELRQIFANLVANAIEAMSESGRLTIKVSPAREWANGNQPGVRVSLMDNGSGIDPDRMAKIFEPFYTTKKDVGTGLGLWLVHGLVEKHGGSIRVKSKTQPGRTVFSVFLPLKHSVREAVTAEDGRETGASSL